MDPLGAREQFAIWLAIVRGEMTESEAASRWGLDPTAVRRLRQVAEQGAMAALSTARETATAQVATPTKPGEKVGRHIQHLLANSPVFEGIATHRLEEFATAATLVVLETGTPVTDQLAAGPLIVTRGTMLAVDQRGAPVGLVGEGAYRGPRIGRRLVPLNRAAVAALPMAAVEAAGLVPRARLEAGASLGARREAEAAVPSAPLGGTALADLVGAPVEQIDVKATDATPEKTIPHLPGTTGLVDVLATLYETGASTLVVTDDATAVSGDGGRPIGIARITDLPLPEDAGAADLGALLAERPTLPRLTAVRPAARRLVRSLLITGTDVEDAGRLLAAINDQLMRQLLTVARAELGPPPGDFAWLVFGSHARGEPTPDSDQDTGLVYTAAPSADSEWFAALGVWMTDALQACGFAPCPGGVMASRAEWRHDFPGWQQAIRRWTTPTETAHLLGADIGLDVRAITGSGALDSATVARELAAMVADASRDQLTSARLVRAAVARRPPNPAWSRVVRNPLGPPLPHRERRFNVKRQGIRPIVDLARLYTLLRGGRELNTAERLAAAAEDRVIGIDLAATLVEGLRLLTWTQVAAQLSDAEGSHVDWTSLSPPLRAQFSETFGAIRSAQDALRARYRLPPNS